MSSTVDKGELIGRRSIIDSVVLSFLSLLNVSDDRMAKTKCFQERLHILMIRMSRVIKLILKLLILEINVGDAWSVLNLLELFVVIGTILAHSNGKLLKLHDVLREGARLITKDVIDHAHFLIETR